MIRNRRPPIGRRRRWTADLQINYTNPKARGLSLSLATVNLLGGLDQALHGADHLHGWGQSPLIDENLLIIRGFDRDARAYRYDVNGNFGTTPNGLGFASPMAVQLRARWTFGGDPAAGPPGAAAARFGATGTGEAALRVLLLRHIVNTPAAVLAIADSLRLSLTAPQIVRLQSAADSLQTQVDAVVDGIVRVRAAGRSTTQADRMAVTAPLLAEAVRLIDAGVASAQRLLDSDQWARLPEAIRKPSHDIPRVAGFTVSGVP